MYYIAILRNPGANLWKISKKPVTKRIRVIADSHKDAALGARIRFPKHTLLSTQKDASV